MVENLHRQYGDDVPVHILTSGSLVKPVWHELKWVSAKMTGGAVSTVERIMLLPTENEVDIKDGMEIVIG